MCWRRKSSDGSHESLVKAIIRRIFYLEFKTGVGKLNSIFGLFLIMLGLFMVPEGIIDKLGQVATTFITKQATSTPDRALWYVLAVIGMLCVCLWICHLADKAVTEKEKAEIELEIAKVNLETAKLYSKK